MEKLTSALIAAGLVLFSSTASAEPVKVGVIGPFSGGAAVFGQGWRAGIETFRALHGEKVGDIEVEFIYRDLPAPDPSNARAIAQELVIRDRVQYLAGIVYTPNALAIGPISQQAQVPLVIFNAAGTSVLDTSDYAVRISYTLPQVAVPAARYAVDSGLTNVVTLVADYAPGHDAEMAFVEAFQAAGGEVLESIRVPLRTSDFIPFAETARALAPDAIFTFFPGGPPAFGMVRAYRDAGLAEAGIKFLGNAETDEADIDNLGEAGIGIETVQFYSGVHDSDVNRTFVAKLAELHPDQAPNAIALQGYDGAALIYHMIEATGGQADAAAAVDAAKGHAWESPRGPVRIDPDTRHIVQNIYVRTVERSENGQLVNREFVTFPEVPMIPTISDLNDPE